MQPNLSPGEVTPRTRFLITSACVVSVIVAWLGMDSMWGTAEWVEESSMWSFGRSAFLYQTGLALAVAAAVVLTWMPRFSVSRLLRVAVLLPVVHVAAIILAGFAWSTLHADIVAAMDYEPSWMPKVALPSVALLVVAFGAVLAIGIALKRRYGEWAHASVMMTLSYLLLLGLWLPVLSRFCVAAPGPFKAVQALEIGRGWYWSWTITERLFSRETFNLLAIVPPALLAIAFTTTVFRYPRLYARVKQWPRTIVKVLLGVGIVSALSLPNEGWLLYLESSYLVMFAVLLAIGALITLTVTTRLGSLAAHFMFRRLPKLEGTIAHEEESEAARFEITSWLRGPRLATRSFVVTTSYGSVPLTGVNVLAPIPAATTLLDVGGHAPVLAPGDRVVISGRKGSGDGHPFRALDATEVAAVAAPGARPYRFSDVTLVVWRPAVAYLAIMLAVALPYLSILLT